MWCPLSFISVGLPILILSILAHSAPFAPSKQAPVKFKVDAYSCASTIKWPDGTEMKPNEQWKNYTQQQAWKFTEVIEEFCTAVPDEAIFGGDTRLYSWTTRTRPFDPHPELSHWQTFRVGSGEEYQNLELYAFGREKQYMCISVGIIGENTWSWSRDSCRRVFDIVVRRCDTETDLLKNGGKIWNEWMVWRVESFNELTTPKSTFWSKDFCRRTAFQTRIPPIAVEGYWYDLTQAEF